ncbi:hypothetical protein [Ramlibacter algicola]|uniref:Uncharacterized protein n=1 Tax=Ramlibacter algicola TaxID=2795217 RepID=A0A934PY61_9BURK|nr:hypothetical protein [Ramlibacter algicola]MBK0392705.1 hypothetical protein [Ramlibacter algicola]
MHLDYLLFDSTDEPGGSCSFDALASVLPARMPALCEEIAAVLGWAHRSFGAPSAFEDADGWDFHLQGSGEHDEPLQMDYDFARNRVVMPPPRGRVTIALTVSGSPAFASAFSEAFAEP